MDEVSARIEELGNKLISSFFDDYLVSCGRERGEASEPDLMHQQTPIAVGRELLINANVSINTGSDLTVRNLVERAEECFEFSYRGPVIDEQGYIDESRAQARMWLGISQSILGMNSQSFDSPQTQGPGFAFAEAATIFLGLQDFRMLGRVLQEWAESLLYVENELDAIPLFQIAMFVFKSFGEQERAGVVLNRLQDLSPSGIDSAFLARRPVPGQEQMTTVLGCRNTSELRRICIQVDNSSLSANEFNQRHSAESQDQQEDFVGCSPCPVCGAERQRRKGNPIEPCNRCCAQTESQVQQEDFVGCSPCPVCGAERQRRKGNPIELCGVCGTRNH